MTSAAGATRSVGRPAAATQDQVLAAATAQFLASMRVDVQAIAAELGLSRATVYRWFGSRDGLLGAVMVSEFQRIVEAARSRSTGVGAHRVLSMLDQVSRWLARSEPYRYFIATEQATAGRIITTSDGPVQPRVVATVAELIDAAIAEGYEQRVDTPTFAYALVRLIEAFLYQDAVTGIRGDVDRLRDVLMVILGLDPQPR
ncbi:QsdR family transcriptional regulator [Nocardia australiensis]|uniref:QsdR family transcriptional regulator n=1 Tax=Nocardia australiensis TaxID=2887191 RepID=UPI001D14CB28|nr:QsdR family transcriptional regulator [Nocardia australiensis]